MDMFIQKGIQIVNIYSKSDIPKNILSYFEPVEIGLEQTPQEYIEKLVCVFKEVKRVLKDNGTMWIVIGDSYAGSGKGAAINSENAKKYLQGTNHGMLGQSAVTRVGWGDCKRKDLIGVPWMLAFALRDDGWYLRQDIIYSKRNAMPESVKDRCTKSHEYIFLLSKSPKYYFDAASISEPVADSTIKKINKNIEKQKDLEAPRYGGKKYTENPDVFYRTKSGNAYVYKPKRNKRSVWHVSTKPLKEAHFATFSPELILPCILAGCPEGGVVLDPFAGSGTTGMVANENGRNFIGIELNPDYAEIMKRRIPNLIVDYKI